MAEIIKNKIQLKRGEGAPSKGLLDVGEPGYDSKNKRLYIGNGLEVDATAIPNEAYVSQKIAEAALSGSGVDLSAYATKEYVNNEIKNVEDNIDIEDVVYADEDGAEASAAPINASTLGGIPAGKYATQEYVIDKIAKAQLEGEDVDLSNYVTKNDLENLEHPVDSVNGKTGAVTLSASEVGATPASHAEDKNNPHGVTIEQIGAAPSGYGLGTSIHVPKDNDANNFRANGFFVCLKNAPLDNGNWFVGYSTYWSDYGYQVVWNVSRTDYQTVYRRTILPNNQFGEWECDNPPMVLGAEYRTTERYNGRPVFKKLITYTFDQSVTVSSYTDISVPTNISNFDNVVSWSAVINNVSILPYWGVSAGNIALIKVNGTSATLRYTKQNVISGEKLVIILAYTKSTN